MKVRKIKNTKGHKEVLALLIFIFGDPGIRRFWVSKEKWQDDKVSWILTYCPDIFRTWFWITTKQRGWRGHQKSSNWKPHQCCHRAKPTSCSIPLRGTRWHVKYLLGDEAFLRRTRRFIRLQNNSPLVHVARHESNVRRGLHLPRGIFPSGVQNFLSKLLHRNSKTETAFLL